MDWFQILLCYTKQNQGFSKDNTFFYTFFFNYSSKQHLVVLMEDDTTLSVAERQIKMHSAPSPAPPPAICSSPVIPCLQPPSPVNKLSVHLCYEQGDWNNQGLKQTASRKQNPPKGRWLTNDGGERAKRGEARQVPRSGWGTLLKTFWLLKENTLCNYNFGDCWLNWNGVNFLHPATNSSFS